MTAKIVMSIMLNVMYNFFMILLVDVLFTLLL